MEKEQSIIIKGIAILMLLFYHLFGIDNINELCKSFIYIKHLPLAHYLSNAAYPVSFFSSSAVMVSHTYITIKG